MPLAFAPVHGAQPGLIASMLKESYGPLLSQDAPFWRLEARKWEAYDREVFNHPQTVGACLFLSRSEGDIVGFASYDPRKRPRLGVIGHNCVLPRFRGQGFGGQQILEILSRFRQMGIERARVTTQDGPFFAPARRMYRSKGFHEAGRRPWDADPSQNLIDYERALL